VTRCRAAYTGADLSGENHIQYSTGVAVGVKPRVEHSAQVFPKQEQPILRAAPQFRQAAARENQRSRSSLRSLLPPQLEIVLRPYYLFLHEDINFAGLLKDEVEQSV